MGHRHDTSFNRILGMSNSFLYRLLVRDQFSSHHVGFSRFVYDRDLA